MNTNNKVVAVLVQTRISVSVDQYKDVYNKQMHPIVMAQPGMIATMAGVITSENGQDPQQTEGGATVLSLVIWKDMESHVAFITGPAAGPFFGALMPLMREPPSVEHYGVDGLQSSAFSSHYAQILKASSADNKQLLANVLKTHTTTEGEDKALFSDCKEDTSKKALVLFSNSDKFEAAGGSVNKGMGIEQCNIEWYARGTNSSH
ncbi:hypothetical protein GGI43DRAFT_415043 [Trichoderma evansii]